MMAFADWQQSRGITPWTTVHQWALLRAEFARIRAVLAEVWAGFVKIGHAIADAFAGLGVTARTLDLGIVRDPTLL